MGIFFYSCGVISPLILFTLCSLFFFTSPYPHLYQVTPLHVGWSCLLSKNTDWQGLWFMFTCSVLSNILTKVSFLLFHNGWWGGGYRIEESSVSQVRISSLWSHYHMKFSIILVTWDANRHPRAEVITMYLSYFRGIKENEFQKFVWSW